MSYDKLMNESDKMMSDLPKLIMGGNETKISQHQKDLEKSAKVTENIKDDIIKLMRKELNEI